MTFAAPGAGARRTTGFTMVEIVVVLTIVAIVSTLAMIMLSRSEMLAREASAIATMRTIQTAQSLYRRTHNAYGTLDQLIDVEQRLIGTSLEDGNHGYHFVVVCDSDEVWYALAWPLEYSVSGSMSYYIDGRGTLRAKDTGVDGEPDAELAADWPVIK